MRFTSQAVQVKIDFDSLGKTAIENPCVKNVICNFFQAN